MRETATKIQLTIPAKAEFITLSRLALTGLARESGIDEEVLADLKLALSEACSNSVRHAYRDGRDGVVDIVYELDSERIAIEVSDDGSGFAEDVQDVEGEELSEGGLGMAIIRAVSDEFDVTVGTGGGVRLRFARRLT
jgi:serine/threonine-protein kinase RsbW